MGTVSAVIPVFNGMKTLATAVESVIQQTYAVQEVIIIDDGSSDDTPSLARSLEQKHSCVTYIRKQNGGVSSARNLGIKHATGEWIAFLDADDYWDPRKLETQMRALANAPQYCASYTGMWTHNQETGEVTAYPAKIYDDIPERLRLNNLRIGASTILVRKSTLLEIGMFDSSFDGSEDWELMLRIAAKGDVILPIAEPLLHYSEAFGSLSTSPKVLERDLKLLNSGRLLVGLTGWKRFYMRRKILAGMYLRAGITSRRSGNSKDALRKGFQSVLSFPTKKGLKVTLVTGIRFLKLSNSISK